MSAPRRLKKSETLEIRLAYPTKQAFMARCQAGGVSASEALRGFIDSEIAPIHPSRGWIAKRWGLDAISHREARRMPRLMIGALIAAAVGAVAVPSLAGPSLVSRMAFERIDANHDGVVTFAEYRQAQKAAH
ncbi:MAG: hypothetical protein ACJ798_10765 [Phenylobacterium sp.]